MKHVKYKLLSEFDGTINGYHISNEDRYYALSYILDIITDKLRQIKIKKEKQFVEDIIIGFTGICITTHTQPKDVSVSIYASLGSFKNNDLRTLKLGTPTAAVSKKDLNIHMHLVNERLKSGYYLK